LEQGRREKGIESSEQSPLLRRGLGASKLDVVVEQVVKFAIIDHLHSIIFLLLFKLVVSLS